MDLPTEVIELGLFPYLRHKELKGMRLNRRLMDIADSVIEKRDRKQKIDAYLDSKAVEHEIIDIKEPLRNLKNKLETKLTIDLAHYDIYLRGT